MPVEPNKNSPGHSSCLVCLGSSAEAARPHAACSEVQPLLNWSLATNCKGGRLQTWHSRQGKSQAAGCRSGSATGCLVCL